MAIVAYTTAQSAKLMASTLVTLLSATMVSSSSGEGAYLSSGSGAEGGTQQPSHEQFCSMSSVRSDPQQIIIGETSEQSRDGPLEEHASFEAPTVKQ